MGHLRLRAEHDHDADRPVADHSPAPERGGQAPVADQLLELQRSAGNAAVNALLEHAQPKMEVGPAGDSFEREADAVADRVAGAHGAAAPTTAEPTVGAVGRRGGALEPDAERALQHARQGGKPLDGRARASMEHALGADLSDVRVHTGKQSAELNASMQSSAFTVGSDIFFRDGAPDAGTPSGRHLLAHELTHTMQQGAAPSKPAVRREFTPSPGGGNQTVSKLKALFERIAADERKGADAMRSRPKANAPQGGGGIASESQSAADLYGNHGDDGVIGGASQSAADLYGDQDFNAEGSDGGVSAAAQSSADLYGDQDFNAEGSDGGVSAATQGSADLYGDQDFNAEEGSDRPNGAYNGELEQIEDEVHELTLAANDLGASDEPETVPEPASDNYLTIKRNAGWEGENKWKGMHVYASYGKVESHMHHRPIPGGEMAPRPGTERIREVLKALMELENAGISKKATNKHFREGEAYTALVNELAQLEDQIVAADPRLVPLGLGKASAIKDFRVRYVKKKERQEFRLGAKGGKVVLGGKPFSSVDMMSFGEGKGWAAFVMSEEGELFAAEHKVGQFHHSSFLKGGKVACAGELRTAADGTVLGITNKSGHYVPHPQHLVQAIDRFGDYGVNMGAVLAIVYFKADDKSPLIKEKPRACAELFGDLDRYGRAEQIDDDDDDSDDDFDDSDEDEDEELNVDAIEKKYEANPKSLAPEELHAFDEDSAKHRHWLKEAQSMSPPEQEELVDKYFKMCGWERDLDMPGRFMNGVESSVTVENVAANILQKLKG